MYVRCYMTHLHAEVCFASPINEDNVATANDNQCWLAWHYPFTVSPTPFCSDLIINLSLTNATFLKENQTKQIFL